MRPLTYYIVLKPVATLLRQLAFVLAPRIVPTPSSTLLIPSRDPKRSIKIHVYSPSSPPKGPLPLLLNFCGSGFVIQGHGLDDDYCHYIARNTDYTVFDIQYRMSPEHPCPAPLEDAEDVITWVQSQPGSYDRSRLGLSGFSAGGNVASSMAANHPGPFKVLVVFYPVVDAVRPMGERVAPERGGVKLPGWFMRFCTRAYLSGEFRGRGADVRVSPILRDVKDGWRVERVLGVSPAGDILAGEVEDWVKKLQAGREEGGRFLKIVDCERVEGCGHAWDKVAEEGTEAWEKKMRVYGKVVELLK
ncbi:Alpha/Beta hydrolase protein [Aspergillus coremiiformis]|uniref:Alpha/Beta hydrolase protein n=1 Tax=Aspergillus coremiiformis TaxID=138285 RepID=A0A5N6ZHC6_9EURO|nr:Alpha/Beta hydrolase protein [Aspergillus coremiiformis]